MKSIWPAVSSRWIVAWNLAPLARVCHPSLNAVPLAVASCQEASTTRLSPAVRAAARLSKLLVVSFQIAWTALRPDSAA
jgi:hypothetical protein